MHRRLRAVAFSAFSPRAFETIERAPARVGATDPMPPITTAIFDIGHVLFQWDPRFLFEKLIDDPEELD